MLGTVLVILAVVWGMSMLLLIAVTVLRVGDEFKEGGE